mgnify:CR=1 FL=1
MSRLMFNGQCYSGGKFLIFPECYSTEEMEIGCWTDGKPLYQRTFTQSVSPQSAVTLATRIDYAILISASYP